MDLWGVDPLIWAAVVTAIVALVGYGLNGRAQKVLDQRRVIFERKVEAYTAFTDALNGVSEQFFALRSVRSRSWRFESDQDLNEAMLVARQMFWRAEIQEQVIGGSSVKELRKSHDAIVADGGRSMSKAAVVNSIKLSVHDIDDLHLNWTAHFVNQCMAANAKMTLYTSDQRVFRLGMEMSRFLRAEQEWILGCLILGPVPSMTDADKAVHSDQFYTRSNALIAALREDLAKNRLPRKVGRDWAKVEASVGLSPPKGRFEIPKQ